jgi:glutathione synthase/RimK-type ligase-like ATP-grasp enzyme
VSAPVATLLTTRRFHPTPLALQRACAALGLELVVGSALDRRSLLAMQWSYDLPAERRAIRAFCAVHGIELINPRVLGRWAQYVRLHAAGVPVPETRACRDLEGALVAARELGFPVVLKPEFGLQSRDVVPAADEWQLRERFHTRHRLVQAYVPEGARCARLLVVGDRVVHAVTRVARDGFHATYAHGRRAALEPFDLGDADGEAAVAACRAVQVAVGGVDLVRSAAGPLVLDVNHRIVELTDRRLHGRDAVRDVALHLQARAAVAAPRGPRQPPRVSLVTGPAGGDFVELLRTRCEQEGLAAHFDSAVALDAGAALFWGVSPRGHHSGAARARALAIPAANGRPETLWRQRGALAAAGIPTPRSRRARDAEGAARLAEVVRYPLVLRPDGDPQQAGPTYVARRDQLLRQWAADGEPSVRACVLEEARWVARPVVRAVVVAGRVLAAAGSPWLRLEGGGAAAGEWRDAELTSRQEAIAVAACGALAVDAGVVELAGDAVLRVLQRNVELPPVTRAEAAALLARRLAELAHSPRGPAPAPAPRPLRVVLARPYAGRGSGVRIWHIDALYRELIRQGHEVAAMGGRYDPQLVEWADLVLQDPLHAFGFGRRGDRLSVLLRARCAERCHLLRQRPPDRADKRSLAALARRLGLRSPEIYGRAAALERLPVIVKPRRGSIGRGVRLARTAGALGGRDVVLQEYVDSGTPYAVSARVITVGERVVAAGLLYHRGALRSNLHRGARAIALTGPGRAVEPAPEEVVLLERLGINPGDRCTPPEVEAMAVRVGGHYAERGARMLGHDFVVDRRGRWYFLETNLAFGVALFNVTDGEGHPSTRRGYRHAGRVLVSALSDEIA